MTVVSDKLTVHAKRVIVAVPPALATRIHYEPGLPVDKDQLAPAPAERHADEGRGVYSEPFWREQGLTGTAVSTEGPSSPTFDNTPPDGSPGVRLRSSGATLRAPVRRVSRTTPAARRS